MIGITALFTALPCGQRAFQLTKCVDYHQSLNNTPVLSRPICPQSGDNRESLISFPHSPSIHILKPDTISQCPALSIIPSPGSGGLIRKDVRCVQYCQFPFVWFARISRKRLDTSEIHLAVGLGVAHFVGSSWWRHRVLWRVTLIVFQCPGPGWGFLECCSVWASLTLFYRSCRLSGAGENLQRQRWARLSGSL